ncbi:MAG: sigma-70 family RNA polymerase sigma factor [Verrucomicrobiales bacterium]|nr:sigma-70 family RNA polymerase sigma factor [Verrucomicrobiales bacterium]
MKKSRLSGAHGETPNTRTRSVGDLTRAIRRGDEAAFDAFYEAYCDRLHRLLLTLTRGDEHTARDVLQTVMIRLARKLPVIENEGELWSWLARVARNALVDQLRRAKRQDELAALTISRESGIGLAESGDDRDLQWLEAAVDTLPPEDRSLVREFYFERRGYKELAAATGKTPKAVESKLARIRHALRAAFNRRISDE